MTLKVTDNEYGRLF